MLFSSNITTKRKNDNSDFNFHVRTLFLVGTLFHMLVLVFKPLGPFLNENFGYFPIKVRKSSSLNDYLASRLRLGFYSYPLTKYQSLRIELFSDIECRHFLCLCYNARSSLCF